MRVAQGGTIRLDAEYISNGVLTDPVDPLVDVLDVNQIAEITDAIPTRTAVGKFFYDFTASNSALLGFWTARWTGTINGVPLTGSETFEVVPAGSIVTDEQIPWITLQDANVAVGANPPLTDEEMVAAAQDIYDYMRWTPESHLDLLAQPNRRNALGRAIAWQAIDRRTTTPSAIQGSGATITSESIGSYSVSYGDKGQQFDAIVASRPRRILQQYGLMRLCGYTGTGSHDDNWDDNDTIIRIS